MSVPATSVPAASVPAASVPAASVPAASVPAASVPATSVPATSVPATSVPAAARRELRERYTDLAVACLALGTADPPLERLATPEVESIAGAIALFLQAHAAADFGAFLEARRADLKFAELELGEPARAGDVLSLHAILAQEFRAPRDALPTHWVPSLSRFWSEFYAEPVLVGVDPRSSRLEVHERSRPVDVVGGMEHEAWLKQYARTLQPVCSTERVVHLLAAVPHRRSLAELMSVQGRLRWFDWRATLELRSGCSTARVTLRFVWDELDGAWFLDDGVTVYPESCDPALGRCFLLL